MNELLQRSPIDQVPAHTGELVQIETSTPVKLVPSRYNARAVTGDGSLVLWNSYSGSMSRFGSGLRPQVEQLLGREGVASEPSRLIKYLVERGFLVPHGTDEYRRVQVMAGEQHYRRDKLELILLASEDCNFRCAYCYEDFARGTMQLEVRERIKKLVSKRIRSLSAFNVSWFGGEPLYGLAAIEDLAPFFLEICQANGVQYGTHMTTNGYLLDEKTADKLFRWNIREFQITLDGLPEDHDRNRPARDGSGTFHTIMGNLQSLHTRKEDFHVAIRVNYDQVNAAGLPKMIEGLAAQFADDPRFSVHFHPVGRWGGPNDENLAICGTDERRKVTNELRATAQQLGLRQRDLRSYAFPGRQVCYAARPFNFIVGADGKLMKCTILLDKKDYNVVGRIKDDGDLELDPDRFSLWVAPAFEQDSGCRKCQLLPSCQGMSCPLVRIEEHVAPCPSNKANLRNELLATSL
ncbi:MAG TPA: radical SAM protein [Candidatus Angelobacter sp.]|jgi:uncharacterized protein